MVHSLCMEGSTWDRALWRASLAEIGCEAVEAAAIHHRHVQIGAWVLSGALQWLIWRRRTPYLTQSFFKQTPSWQSLFATVVATSLRMKQRSCIWRCLPRFVQQGRMRSNITCLPETRRTLKPKLKEALTPQRTWFLKTASWTEVATMTTRRAAETHLTWPQKN